MIHARTAERILEVGRRQLGHGSTLFTRRDSSGERVVAVCEVVIGDLAASGEPDLVMGGYVVECFLELLHPMRLPDEEWMQGQAHHPAALRTFHIEPVE